MNKLYRNHLHLKGGLSAFVGVCLLIYFSVHALQGERGVFTLMSLGSQIETLSANSDRMSVEREALERKVSMMRPGNVDKDLLEERVRLTLGYKYSDEYAVLRH